MQGEQDRLLSVYEGAEFLGINPHTLRRLAWERKIRSFKVLSRLRFKKSDLQNLITERPPVAK